MSLIESDVRAALDWSLGSTTDHDDGRTGCGLQLVAAMTTYWYRFGYAAEGRGWFGRVLRLAETVETLEMANALHGVAVLQLQLGDISPAAEGLQRALDMVRRLGNRDAEARELNSLAVAHRERGDHAESRRLLEQSLRTAREIGNVRRESTALANLVMVLVDTADWEAALVASRQAVAASRALGDDWAAACDESNLAMALLRTEGADAAYAHLAAVAPRAVALEDNELSIAILELFAAIVAELGEDELAARLLAVSDRQRAVVGMPRSKPDQALLNRSLDASRARDDQGWLAAYEEGLRLDPTQAMAQAMSVRVTGGTTTGPVR
jgi:tetratricopeptide (TPR) repeat protein